MIILFKLISEWFVKCCFFYTERNYLFKGRLSALTYYGDSLFLNILSIILKVIFFIPFILCELIQYLIIWLAAWPLVGLPPYFTWFVLNLFSFVFFWIMMLPNINEFDITELFFIGEY